MQAKNNNGKNLRTGPGSSARTRRGSPLCCSWSACSSFRRLRHRRRRIWACSPWHRCCCSGAVAVVTWVSGARDSSDWGFLEVGPLWSWWRCLRWKFSFDFDVAVLLLLAFVRLLSFQFRWSLRKKVRIGFSLLIRFCWGVATASRSFRLLKQWNVFPL